MIFQDPYSSLNPRHTVGTIVGTPFKISKVTPEGGVKKRVQELLEIVGLNPEHYNRYPHEFSGGQRQRICIARALAMEPELLIADEAVSALDVSVQARLLDLIRGLVKRLDLAAIVVTHDLAVARLLSSRMMVMQQGQVIEQGLTDQILEDPQAPYTQLLVSSVLQV